MEKTPTHKIVAVDIDGVIIDSMNGDFDIEEYSPLDLGKHPTMPGCKRVLQRLFDHGFTVVLYTSRTNPDWPGNKGHNFRMLTGRIALDMRKRGIPFHYISKYKPVADMYIDDRGWHFRDWKQMERDLEMLGWIK